MVIYMKRYICFILRVIKNLKKKTYFYRSYKSSREQPRSKVPLNSPPYFNGSNYPHQKAQMEFFLKRQGERLGMKWNMDEEDPH